MSGKRYGLVAERVAFANKVDARECPDFANFVQEKVNYESFLEWARMPEERKLCDELWYPVPKQSFYHRFISSLIP